MAKIGRILIAGGGIGGLSAAAALARVGFRAEVFEQAPALREVGAGVGLWSNALASLDQLGAGHAVRAGCTPLRLVGGADVQGNTLTAIDLDELGAEFANAACFVVKRPALLSALAKQVPREHIHTGCRVERAALRDGAVELQFDGGRVESGELLIGADGLHSTVRPLVIAADTLRYSGQTCLRGLARWSAPRPHALREVQGRGQRGSVCPVDDETAYWWVAFNHPRDTVLPEATRQAYLLERYRGWPFGLADAIAATPSEEILQNDLVDRPPAKRYTEGPIALVGDAAHPTTPNLGQGANMAIDDAIVLARALRDEPTVAIALARYERERLPRTRLIVQRSWSVGRLSTWNSGLGVVLRNAMMRATPKRVLRDMLRWQILDDVGVL